MEFYILDGVDVSGYRIEEDTDFTFDSENSSKKQKITFVQGSNSRHVVFELSSSKFNNN